LKFDVVGKAGIRWLAYVRGKVAPSNGTGSSVLLPAGHGHPWPTSLPPAPSHRRSPAAPTLAPRQTRALVFPFFQNAHVFPFPNQNQRITGISLCWPTLVDIIAGFRLPCPVTTWQTLYSDVSPKTSIALTSLTIPVCLKFLQEAVLRANGTDYFSFIEYVHTSWASGNWFFFTWSYAVL